ncbi:Homocysteine S-methyltransferase [Roseovarius albus]|uniref:Homocysteine S-methyltransferase n=1 Tax=Roseovarius albus TaxID=1247867 RepID=A0A1X6YY16_9RHOB|nr:homocysteine S-methyltransferase family protein [Roseovarius albus]SLN34467.1 Homocysteine S-methyltransferase [Roseovarius albus]
MFDDFHVVLGQGSMYERLRRSANSAFDPEIAHAGMLYNEIGREVLADTHREYLDIGQEYGIPMIAGTPTWRAGNVRINRSQYRGESVNTDAVEFIKCIRQSYGPDASPILISGVMGPFGDGYISEEAPDRANAVEIHRPQIEDLAEAGVDFLKAQTLPSFEEAKGIAQAMVGTGLPYLLSFVIRRDGNILDGTSLDEAIDVIDNESIAPPTHYAINCVHTSVFSAVYANIHDCNPSVAERILGIDANTSAKTPEELDGLDEIDTEAPVEFGKNVFALHQHLGIKCLGGCCGSSTEHIAELAQQISGTNR